MQADFHKAADDNHDDDYEQNFSETEHVNDYLYVQKSQYQVKSEVHVPDPVEKPVWRLIGPLKIAAMNLARKTSYKRDLIPKPKVTKDKISIIKAKLEVFNPLIGHKIIAFKSKGRMLDPKDIDAKTVKFFDSIKKYQFFSFDTEGAGKLKFNRGPKKGEEGRSVLMIGNANGDAVIFYDPNNVTEQFQKVVADPTIL